MMVVGREWSRVGIKNIWQDSYAITIRFGGFLDQSVVVSVGFNEDMERSYCDEECGSPNNHIKQCTPLRLMCKVRGEKWTLPSLFSSRARRNTPLSSNLAKICLEENCNGSSGYKWTM